MALPLDAILDQLETRYGRLPKPPPRTAFEWVVHENACYLVDDARRDAVFLALEKRIGCDPKRLLEANRATLLAILEPGGMKPPMRLEKLIDCATLCVTRHGGDLESVLDLPTSKALIELAKYRGIGRPGAEKILLFAGGAPSLALESNGLRVLLRLGHGKDDPSYAKAYKSAQAALAPQVGTDPERLIRLHLTLRHHGKETCKWREPRCGECPLRRDCPSSEA